MKEYLQKYNVFSLFLNHANSMIQDQLCTFMASLARAGMITISYWLFFSCLFHSDMVMLFDEMKNTDDEKEQKIFLSVYLCSLY